MKAMILAAGLGTRLLPLTEKKPKPLFPLAGRPVLDILIRKLEDSHFETVMINTHHLANMIEAFVRKQRYGIPVHTTYEPTILDTGGGIKNVEDFWDDRPFLVINSDIYTNIDLNRVYQYHQGHQHPVTMVLHDYEVFNTVWVDASDCIRGFGTSRPCPPAGSSERPQQNPIEPESTDLRLLAFTGIQVVDPQVLLSIPKGTSHGIIDVYCEMISRGTTLKAFIAQNHYWHDIGTMAGYGNAAKDALARQALTKISPGLVDPPLMWSKLKGDGSDRIWRRASSNTSSVILVEHGRPPNHGTCEADSFVAIGRHLFKKGIPVPEIYDYDRSLGLVVLEDLGDLHLQTAIRRTKDPAGVLDHYGKVIDILVSMAVDGAEGFGPSFTYQTPFYDSHVILEKEAKYFCRAFLQEFINDHTDFETLKEDFDVLAKSALKSKHIGFLHRDFQSRNILLSRGRCYVIDFQGGRLGPLQYDLASLLIDPYVALPRNLQEVLLKDYMEKLSRRMPVDPSDFGHAYRYCAINRNLQILGAFAFLGKTKGKKAFLDYIPIAVQSLKDNLKEIEPGTCERLRSIVGRL
jgi:aminoglycoside/choline kinase family phosphotransferase/dTDP-glucose pyrophosphorylase